MVDQIPNWACRFLSKSDMSAVEAAVKAAESRSSGEIVPMLVRSSTPIGAARRIVLLLLLLTFFALSPFAFSEMYDTKHLIIELCYIVLAVVASYMLPIPGFVLRFLFPKTEQDVLVQARAELEFYRSRIHLTEGKTGILLFVSLAEHRAVVLADKAIADKLPQSTWDEVLSLMLGGFKSKQVAGGFSEAIAKCGDILAAHFPRDADDRDELGNTLQMKE